MSKKAIVFLIHGTGAGSDSDEGDQWWQRGSSVWNKISTRLPDDVVHNESVLFHWSGENSDAARYKGAWKLLDYLADLEAKKIPYHLVGHSHGGTLIWQALVLSQMKKFKRKWWQRGRYGLRSVKSWTTVGTPFLQYRSMAESRRNSSGFFSFTAAITRFLFRYLCGILFLLSLCAMVLLPLLLFLIDQNNIYRPGIMLGCIFFVIVVLTAPLLARLNESVYFGREKRVEHLAMRYYEQKWNGIWSEDDEAINGLKATLSMRRKIIPRLQARELVFLGESWLKFARFLTWPLASFYNVTLVPLADRFIWSSITRKLQGNDRPGTKLRLVSATPNQLFETCKPLAKGITASLRKNANAAASRRISEVRNLLGQMAMSNNAGLLLEGLARSFSGAELIHTTYFENDKVLDLIVAHIKAAS